MSVLLTAVKKKSDKAKQAASRRVSGGSTGPPRSNAHTTVWYWSPDSGSTMTVMYTAYNRELWCNGSTVANARERMDPLMGIVTDFIISETGHDHQAHVVHLPDGGHVLYVDGYLIPEHTG